MSLQRRLGVLALVLAVPVFLAGCSHAMLINGGPPPPNTSPMILTMHDSNSPVSGVTVTSFEATVKDASLTTESGTAVPLLSASQKIEFTQLQTNSVYLSTTQVALGNYTSLTITYANPQYTIFNGTGASLTINGQTCAAAAECVITSPTVDNVTGTVTFSSQIAVQQNNQTLIEVDVNLNDLIQSTFDVDFSKSIAATVTQGTNASAAIGDPLRVSGQVTAVNTSASQFTITPAIGPQLTITTAGTTAFEFSGASPSCTPNNFTCISSNQILDVTFNIMANGTAFDATEVDFDDAGSTQQVSGQIVAMDATPPTTLTIVVHNTIPPAASLPNGSLATVTISTSTTDPVTYVINNGALVLPSSPTLSFASTSDVIVGQEVEARVASGATISGGAFTTDRLALEPTQLQATATTVNATAQPPQPSFVLPSSSSTNPLPSLFVDNPLGTVTQIQVLTVTQGSPVLTLFQALSPNSMSGITTGTVVSTGGFLFNTPSVGSPTIVATVVRGQVSGT
jgi:hypothetical protein